MSTWKEWPGLIRLAGLACIAALAGCDGTIIINTPDDDPEVVLAVTGRTIPEGAQLGLTFTVDADREVVITVQADTDAADPNFQVVRGEVDFEDLQDIPIADLVVVSTDRAPGEEQRSWTPDEAGDYTIFISDEEDVNGARFSVTITQEVE